MARQYGRFVSSVYGLAVWPASSRSRRLRIGRPSYFGGLGVDGKIPSPPDGKPNRVHPLPQCPRPSPPATELLSRETAADADGVPVEPRAPADTAFSGRRPAVRWQLRPRRALRAARDACWNAARRAMLLRRRRRARRAGSYLDGEQGKSKAVVLEWIPGSGTVVHVETTGSCRVDSWWQRKRKVCSAYFRPS